MALALAATMPSGDPIIVRIRDALYNALPRQDCIGKPVVGSASVASFDSSAHPWRGDMVYVGHGPIGTNRVLASPWGNPCLRDIDTVCNCEGFEDYLWSRCDIREMLAPLVGKTLVCHTNEDARCHAHILCEVISILFGPMVEESFTDYDTSKVRDAGLATSLVVLPSDSVCVSGWSDLFLCPIPKVVELA